MSDKFVDQENPDEGEKYRGELNRKIEEIRDHDFIHGSDPKRSTFHRYADALYAPPTKFGKPAVSFKINLDAFTDTDGNSILQLPIDINRNKFGESS